MTREEIQTCERCHCETYNPIEESDGMTVCPRCSERHYRDCDGCGERRPNTGMYYSYADGWLCESCYEDGAVACLHCGETFYGSDGYWSDAADASFCSEECREEYEDAHCRLSYWHSEDIIWERRGHGDLYMGVELEVDDGHDPVILADEVRDLSDRCFYLAKTDGSLSSYGVEFVSHPATLAYHMGSAQWPEVAAACKRHDYTSHDNGRCGLHVHINREFFGKGKIMQTANAVKIMNLFDRFEYQFNRFSRRMDFHYCGKNTVLDPSESSLLNRAARKMSEYESRYHAVNIENPNTIEIRLWRGTLNVETLLASLQMTAGLAQVCKERPEGWLMKVDWYTLCDEIGRAASKLMGSAPNKHGEYEPPTEFVNYLSRRGLSNWELDEVEEVA